MTRSWWHIKCHPGKMMTGLGFHLRPEENYNFKRMPFMEYRCKSVNYNARVSCTLGTSRRFWETTRRDWDRCRRASLTSPQTSDESLWRSTLGWGGEAFLLPSMWRSGPQMHVPEASVYTKNVQILYNESLTVSLWGRFLFSQTRIEFIKSLI